MTRQFFEWKLDWHDYLAWCRSQHTQSEYRDQTEFYNRRAAQMAINWNFVSVRDEAETYWLRHGAPYYNVHPALVEKLCRINLKTVPAHLVELPHEFQAVNIRFCQQHDELTLHQPIEFGKDVKWVDQVSGVPAGSWLHSMLMLRPTPRMLKIANVPVLRDANTQVLFLFDFDLLHESGVRTWGICPLLWQQEDDTLEDAIMVQEMLARQKSESYQRLCANCMRLAVTIGFLANSNDQLIEPDVLSKDRFAYEQADEAKRKTIIDRAHRRGKTGWNVGNDLMLLGDVKFTKPHEGEPGEGRELQWAHIRSGHPHAVRYGPKHSKVKIMWFRPTIVKADKPFKPT